MAKPFATRTLKVMEHFRKNPDAAVLTVAAKHNMAISQVYQLRKRVRDEVDTLPVDPTPGPTPEHDAAVHASSAIKQAKRLYVPVAAAQIAKKMGISVEEYVKEVRKINPTAFEQTNDLTPDEVTMEPNETDVDAVLDSRAQDYGKFIEGAEIMQMLKRLVHNHIDQRNKQLAFDQREALDMIIHKIGRIINGNPDKVDNWVDIAGYAKLVADRREGNVR